MLINVRCVYLEDEGLPQPDPGKITGQKGKKKKAMNHAGPVENQFPGAK